MLLASGVMFSMVMATTYAVNTPKIDTKDTNSVQIESKAKSINYKIT